MFDRFLVRSDGRGGVRFLIMGKTGLEWGERPWAKTFTREEAIAAMRLVCCGELVPA